MKKFIITFVIGCISSVCANLPEDVALGVTSGAVSGMVSDLKIPEQTLEKMPASKQAFFYVRFAAAESNLLQMESILPGLGIGYRRLAGNGAADISISGIGVAERKNEQILWTLPRASYYRYLQPDQTKSFYLGGGVAWGGIDTKKRRFIGIIPSATVGYEFARKSTILGFTEFNVSQPAAAVYKKGTFPGPIVECTVGMGF